MSMLGGNYSDVRISEDVQADVLEIKRGAKGVYGRLGGHLEGWWVWL